MRDSAKLEKKLRRGFFMAVMMGPAIIGFLIFYVYVNFNSLVMAFQVPIENGFKIGFDNFTYFFVELSLPDSRFLEAIKNTGVFFLIGYVSLAMALVVAYFISKKIVGYKFFRFIYYIPCIIMATATASLFQYILAYKGPIGALVMNFGKKYPDILADDRYALFALIFYNLFFGVGGNMILFLGSMTNISPEIFEAGKLDGVGWVREIFQIIIPLIWPTFSVMILQSIVGLTQASGPVFLLTKGEHNTDTINYWLYEQLLNGSNLEISAAVGWLCTAFTFPIAMVVKYLLNKADEKLGV